MAAIAASLTALLAVGVPAHAVGVNAPLPQTLVPVPQTQVTAPGADVTVGPGGVAVNVDPEKAIGGVTGGQPPVVLPPAGSPANETSRSLPQAGGGGGSPGQGGSTAPGGRSPAPGSRPGRGSAGAPAPRGTGRRTASGSARDTGSGSATPAGADTRTVASRGADRRERARPSPVRQIIERIPTELLAALLATALLAAAMSLVWLRERGRVRAAQRQAQVDALTGIPNRFAFEQRLAGEWKRARRYGRPLGLMLVDLDGLKLVNDRDGHEAGDRMIKAAAVQISDDTRQSDFAARLAGDEFVVVCPETPRHGLEQLGAKLTQRLQQGGIAASVGWAELADKDVAPGDLLARADAAMYVEKARRRAGGPAPRAQAGLAIAG